MPVVIGLFLLEPIYYMETIVNLFGIRSPPLSTGVVQSSVLRMLGTCASMSAPAVAVSAPTSLRRVCAVSVPSGVFYIELCTL